MTDKQTTAPSLHLVRLGVTWVVALILILIAGFFAPKEMLLEATLVLIGITLVLSFLLQMATGQREGFVTRVSFSSVVSATIIAIGSLIFWSLG